jgi:YgiT-type zinc finger domain-containing protein
LKCLLCKDGNTAPGKTVVTLSRKEFKFVFRNVPAMICHDCSEVYITEEISGLLLNIANESFKKGEASYTKDFIKS